jgi:hypothetical protein
MSEIIRVPSRADIVPSDSWQGLNLPLLATWAAKDNPLPQQPPSPPLARTKRLTGFQILATGSYAPDTIVSNDDLQARHGFVNPADQGTYPLFGDAPIQTRSRWPSMRLSRKAESVAAIGSC